MCPIKDQNNHLHYRTMRRKYAADLPSLTLWEWDSRNLDSSHATRHTCNFTRSFTKVARIFSQMTFYLLLFYFFSVRALRDASGPISHSHPSPCGWETDTHAHTLSYSSSRGSPSLIDYTSSCTHLTSMNLCSAVSAPRCRIASLVKIICTSRVGTTLHWQPGPLSCHSLGWQRWQ